MIGIYLLENKVNGKKYVGQSKNISKRFTQHMKKKSCNKFIEEEKYIFGIENFSLTVLEICREQDLDEKENFYFDLIKPEYNINKHFNSPRMSKTTKEKMRKSAMIRLERDGLQNFINSGEKNRYKKKKVISINLDTKEEIIHDSLYEAQKFTLVPRSSIHQIINGKRKKSKGFIFKYLN